MKEDQKHTRHLTHALIMVVLWVPVLLLELSLLQGNEGLEGGIQQAENPLWVLLVLALSVGLLAGVLWKMILYFKEANR
jgi:hypothetical protein